MSEELFTPPPIDPSVVFLGEITNATLGLSYSSLASLIGVINGTVINEGSGFLEFNYDGTMLLVTKKTIRQNISWDQIHSADGVYGTKQITVNNKTYKARLLQGADLDPTSVGPGSYMAGTHLSEWSRLFYPIIKDDVSVPTPPRSPNAPFSSKDLDMGTGRHQWCQETFLSGSTRRIVRGQTGSSYVTNSLKDYASHYWRPCLELVE